MREKLKETVKNLTSCEKSGADAKFGMVPDK